MTMGADRFGDAADAETEVRSLRKDLRDLTAVLSLPLMWRGRSPAQIAENLTEVLVSLLRLDFLHLRLEPGTDGQRIERTRDLRAGEPGADPRRLVEALASDLDGEGSAEGPAGPAGAPLRLARVVPGFRPEWWLVVAGSYRDDFPTDRERYLLRVTVDQASVCVETARLVHEAEQASLAKSQFIATMSHELRTPLNAILGYIDLLLLGVPDAVPDGARSHVDRVQASARHLLHLIDNILNFSRIEAGHEEVRIDTVDLARLTLESCELLEPLARRKGLAFRCVVPDQPLPMPTDGAKVRQIVFNLVSNAIKFTDAGSVEVSVEQRDNGVIVSVEDTGIGVPAAERDRIFEPFRQVEDSFTRRTGGTGLGLSVARRLSELLGGSVDVTSQVGEGSTFTLCLPDAGSLGDAGSAPSDAERNVRGSPHEAHEAVAGGRRRGEGDG